MPYIRSESRERFNADLASIAARLGGAGDLNYVITQLLIRYRGGAYTPGTYSHLNEVIGAIISAKDEFVRRVVAPYEDTKIQQNGDIY